MGKMTLFKKKPNRTAQAVVTTAAVATTVLATSVALISWPAALVGGGAWWVTGRLTRK